MRSETRIDEIMSGIQKLLLGNLPITLVTPTDLAHSLVSLENILKTQHPNLEIDALNLSSYYKLRDVKFTWDKSYLYVSIAIPLKSQHTKEYNLLEISALNIPSGPNSTDQWARVQGLPDFLAVTDDLTSVMELSESDIRNCDYNSHFRRCKDFIPYPLTANGSCAQALFFRNQPNIDKYCEIALTRRPDSKKRIIGLGHNQYFISKTRNSHWEYTCKGSSTKLIESCVNCLVN